MTELKEIDLRALATGSKRTWDAFVVASTPLINAVVRRSLSTYRLSEEDVMDAAQDVYVRLCANDYRLLKTYDPGRASIATWLAVVSRSSAVDHARRRRQSTTPIDDVPEAFLGYETKPHAQDLIITGVGEIDSDQSIRPNFATNTRKLGKTTRSLGPYWA